TLTDEEKREARGTDERSRQIIERADNIPPEVFERLHGAIRDWGPDFPASPSPASLPPPDLTPDPSPISHPTNRERGAPTRPSRARADELPPLPGVGWEMGEGDRGGEVLAELSAWESFLNPPGVVPPEEATIEV